MVTALWLIALTLTTALVLASIRYKAARQRHPDQVRSSTMGDEQPPVVSRGPLPPWSDTESAAYEAAAEAINEVVGCYSSLVAAERAKTQPDEAALSRWRAARGECETVRRALDPADAEAVANVRKQYTDLGRQLREQLAGRV
jgi:hypothetical protein